GGHGVIFALRRLLGGGGQGGRGRFAEGGKVDGGTIDAEATIRLSSNMQDFGEEFRKSWAGLLRTARTQSAAVAKEFRDMRVAIDRTMSRMARDTNETW